MNNENQLDQFFAPPEGAGLQEAFVRSVAFDVDEGFADSLPAHIIANFDEVKAALAAGTAKYRSVVVTEETIDAAKATCAALNKQAARIDEVRKRVKKTWTKPLAEFEARCKECTEIILSAREEQWSQVKAFEEAAKAAKKEELLRYWEEIASDLVKMYFHFDDVLEDSWLTKGKSIAAAKGELREKAETLAKDMSFIRESGGQYAPAGYMKYLQTRSIPDALSAIEQAKAASSAIDDKKPSTTAQNAAETTKADEAVLCIDFRVRATRAKLDALKAFLVQNGIQYGRVPTNNTEV